MIIRNTERTFARERLASNRLSLLINIAASFLVNLLLIITLASGGITFTYIIFPILICVFDAVFLAASLFTNFRFSYSTIYTVIFTALFVITSAVYATILLRVLGETKAIAITYLALAMWASVAVVSIVAILIGAYKAGRNGKRMIAVASVLVLCLCVGIYSYGILSLGFFGQGESAEQRPVTFVYDENNEYYVATGLVKGRGGAAVIPETFNGVKVGAIDCALFLEKNLKTVTFSSKDILFSNVDALWDAPTDLQLFASKSHINTLMNRVYTMASAQPDMQKTLTTFAKSFAPSDLDENEVCVLFHYEGDALASAEERFLPIWIGNKSEAFSLDYANSIDYVSNRNAKDETLLAMLYDLDANGGGYILSDLRDKNGILINGQTFTDKVNTIDVSFDKIYRLQIMDDNDTKYELSNDFRYLSESNHYRFVTKATAEKLLDKSDKRNGFDLSWDYAESEYASHTSLTTLPSILEDAASESFMLYPIWSLQAPEISLCKTEGDQTVFTYGDNLRFLSEATAPTKDFDLRYSWSRGNGVIAETDAFDISKVMMTEAGKYTLTVTAYSDTLTSLTSTATSAYSIDVQKKQLPIQWIGFDGTDSFRKTYDSEAAAPVVTYDNAALVYSYDEISFTFNFATLKDAKTYDVTVGLLNGSDKYELASTATKKSYVIDKKEVDIAWSTEDLVYTSYEILPPVSFTDGVCVGDSVTVSAVGKNADGQIVAGVHRAEAVLSGAQKDNYTIKTAQKTCDYTIQPASLTLDWTDLQQIYTSKTLLPNASISGLRGMDTIEDLSFEIKTYKEQTTKVAKDAGSYTAKASIKNTNYQIVETDRERSFVITPAELTLSFTNTSQIYAAKALTPTYTVTGTCSGDTVASLLISLTSATHVGTHKITATVGNPNYRISAYTEAVDFEITPKMLTVNWNTSTALTYNGSAQYLGIKSVVGILDTEKVAVIVDTARSQNTNASDTPYTSYAILSGDSTLIGNYEISAETSSKSYTIVPKRLTLEWGTTTFTYDGLSHAPTATIISGICASDTVNVTVDGARTTAVTNATATAVLDNTNYTATNSTKSFTIRPKELTVSWTELVFTYNGETQHPIATIHSGIVGSDIVNLKVTGNKAAGNYTATASIENGNANYTLTNSTVAYIINKKEVDVLWQDDGFSYVYNAKNQAPVAVLNSTLFGADTLQIIVTGQKNAGSHTAIATSSNPNYAISEATAKQEYTITKLTVSVSFTTTDRTYNGKMQTPAVTLQGKPSGDTVTLIYEVTDHPDGAKNAGTYTVTVKTENANYTLDPATVTLESFKILPKEVTAAWSNLELTYNGTAQNPTVTLSGVVAGETVAVTLSDPQTAVGTYTATASISDPNYKLSESSATKSFKILPKELTVVWSATELTYNGNAQNPTVKLNGVISGETVAVTLSDPQTAVGTYTATASISDPNYKLSESSASKTFKILAKEVTAVWSNLTFTYNGTAQNPTVTLNGVIPGETVAVTLSDPETEAGTYTATASISDPNYTLSDASKSQSFEILPLEVFVTWNAQNGATYTENGQPQAPAASANGQALSYTFEKYNETNGTFEAIATAPSAAGRYRITAKTSSENHTLANATLEFSILAATVID